ncbi:hypothetical protein [Microbacterium sp. 22242]|uniref:hypothetical protein n=1 Tax=Microbacterium sp. 22242 TaxID=3453896 RepID=UPI003F856733
MTRPRTGIRVAGTALLFGLGIVVGLILQNVWLGLVLALLVWLVWFLGYESRQGRNAGIHDEDNGIEL